MARPVLIVDDDDNIRSTITEILEQAGYLTIGVSDGEEAMAQLHAGVRPAVILLDMMMPGMDGLSFQAELMKHTGLTPVPILVMTADHRLRDQVRPQGVFGYLAKPMDPASLLAAVARFY